MSLLTTLSGVMVGFKEEHLQQFVVMHLAVDLFCFWINTAVDSHFTAVCSMVHLLEMELEASVNRWKMKPIGSVCFLLIYTSETMLDQCVYFEFISLRPF